MTDKEKIYNIIKRLPIFAACALQKLEEFAAQSSIHHFPKGQVIFVNEDKATRFFSIIDGWIKLYRETLDGTQAVVDVLPMGQIFGETSLFQDNIYPYSAEAAENATLISLPLSLLKAEIDENPKMAQNMLYSMAQYRQKQDREIEHRALQSAPQRIGCFLLRLVNQKAKGTVTINLPYDKTLIAARLGMQPETFSRALNKLKETTGITIKGSTVEMDSIQQLEHFSCAACSSEFPCRDLKTHSVNS